VGPVVSRTPSPAQLVIAQAERSLRSFAPWGEVPHLLRGLLPVPRGAERAERSEESPIPNTILIPHSFLAEPAHTSTLSGMQPGKSVLPRSGAGVSRPPRCCWSSCSASPQVPPSAALQQGGGGGMGTTTEVEFIDQLQPGSMILNALEKKLLLELSAVSRITSDQDLNHTQGWSRAAFA
jgi:hypothetical protein